MTALPTHLVRPLLGASVALLVLAGCSAPAEPLPEPWISESPSASAAPESNGVAHAAQTFAATLDDGQRAALVHEQTFANAARWSNLPERFYGNRIGLATGTLDAAQWDALLSLLAAALGAAADEGVDEIRQLLVADDNLAANGGAGTGRGEYRVAFLGSPTEDGTWALQFGGHHVAILNSYADGLLVGATPAFRGVEPLATFESAGTVVQPLAQEMAAFRAVLASFDAAQAAAARIDAPADLMLGPGVDGGFPGAPQGIAVASLSPAQRDAVLAAIATHVDDLEAAAAAAILAEYELELDETFVAYGGELALAGSGDYLRIDGPSVWIELSMQNGFTFRDPHPHIVWRDEHDDYGGRTP